MDIMLSHGYIYIYPMKIHYVENILLVHEYYNTYYYHAGWWF